MITNDSQPLWKMEQTFNGPEGGVESVALEDSILVIGVNDSMSMRNIKTGGFNSVYNKSVTRVAINKGIIVSGSTDGTVKIWNSSGQLQKTFKEHGRYISSIAKKNDTVASASLDGTVKIWNIHQDQSLLTLQYTSELESVAMNDTLVIAGAKDGKAIAWDINSGKKCYEIAHGYEVGAVAVNDTMVFTGSYFLGDVKVWNIHDGNLIKTLNIPYDGIKSIAMNNDKAAIISKFGKTIILNIHNDQFIKFNAYADGRHFYSLAMSENLLAIGTSRGANAVKVLSVDALKKNSEFKSSEVDEKDFAKIKIVNVKNQD